MYFYSRSFMDSKIEQNCEPFCTNFTFIYNINWKQTKITEYSPVNETIVAERACVFDVRRTTAHNTVISYSMLFFSLSPSAHCGNTSPVFEATIRGKGFHLTSHCFEKNKLRQ